MENKINKKQKLIVGKFIQKITRQTKYGKEYFLVKVRTDEKLTNHYCRQNNLEEYNFLNSTNTLYDFSETSSYLKTNQLYLFHYENDEDDISKSENWWKLVFFEEIIRPKENPKENNPKGHCKFCQVLLQPNLGKKKYQGQWCSESHYRAYRKQKKEQGIIISQEKTQYRQELLLANPNYQQWITVSRKKREWDLKASIDYICQNCSQNHKVSYQNLYFYPSKIRVIINNNWCLSNLGGGCQGPRFLNQPLCYNHLRSPKWTCLTIREKNKSFINEEISLEDKAIQLIVKARQNKWDSVFDNYQIGLIKKKDLCEELSFQYAKENQDNDDYIINWKETKQEIEEWIISEEKIIRQELTKKRSNKFYYEN